MVSITKISFTDFTELYPFIESSRAEYLYVIDNKYYITESCDLKNLNGLYLSPIVSNAILTKNLMRQLVVDHEFLPLYEEHYVNNRDIKCDKYLDYWYGLGEQTDKLVALVRSISGSVDEYVNALYFMGYINYHSPLHMRLPERYVKELNTVTSSNYRDVYEKWPCLDVLVDVLGVVNHSKLLYELGVSADLIGQLANAGHITYQTAIESVCFHDYSELQLSDKDVPLVVSYSPELDELVHCGFTNVLLHSYVNKDHPDRNVPTEKRQPRRNTLIHFDTIDRYPLYMFKRGMNVEFFKGTYDRRGREYINDVESIIRPSSADDSKKDLKPHLYEYHNQEKLISNTEIFNEIMSNPHYTQRDLVSIFGVLGLYL